MNIFERIADIFRKFWEWLKSLFGDKKKNPLIKITILTIFLMFFTFDNSYAQRTDLQYLYAYFTQPKIENNDYWTVNWHNGVADSLDVYKNDTLRASIKNELGEFVAFTYFPGLDTAEVRVKVDRPFDYDVTFTFDIIAKDTLGNMSDSSDFVQVRFLVSDMNKIVDPDMDTGYRIGDHSVDGLDLLELSKNFGKTGMGYRDFVDINGDGYVDGLDLIQLSKDFGKTWTP